MWITGKSKLALFFCSDIILSGKEREVITRYVGACLVVKPDPKQKRSLTSKGRSLISLQPAHDNIGLSQEGR